MINKLKNAIALLTTHYAVGFWTFVVLFIINSMTDFIKPLLKVNNNNYRTYYHDYFSSLGELWTKDNKNSTHCLSVFVAVFRF